MADVFISYSKADRREAEALAEDLKLHGYTVWWDTALYGGEDFHDVILQALDDAKAAIVIWSESSVKSHWVRGEAQHAQSQRKLIPTRFAKLRDASIPLNFRALHTELLEDRERILRAIERLAGKRRQRSATQDRIEEPAAPANSHGPRGVSRAKVGTYGRRAEWSKGEWFMIGLAWITLSVTAVAFWLFYRDPFVGHVLVPLIGGLLSSVPLILAYAMRARRRQAKNRGP